MMKIKKDKSSISACSAATLKTTRTEQMISTNRKRRRWSLNAKVYCTIETTFRSCKTLIRPTFFARKAMHSCKLILKQSVELTIRN